MRTIDLGKYKTSRLLVIFVVIVITAYIVLDIWNRSESSASSGPIISIATAPENVNTVIMPGVPQIPAFPAVAKPEREEMITILFWTKYYGHDPLKKHLLPPVTEGRPECFKSCRLVPDRSYENTAHAILFHSSDLSLDDMPKDRSSKQVWIYLERESPAYTAPNLKEFANVFNWTMTYRRDSDVHFPYGRFSKRNEALPSDSEQQEKLKDILDKKAHGIYWVVSNCTTIGKRENFVTELKKYIPVHIFGKCNEWEMSCPGLGRGGCLPELSPQYKFYLSFENSLCWDYATTELYNVLHNLTVIPIVYGGGDYDALAPPHSVINVKDFNSTEELANYLKFLNGNTTEYLKYFQWRREYQVTSETFGMNPDPWCNLCEKLVEQRRNPRMKSYLDLWTWWNFRTVNITGSDTDSLPVCSNASTSLPTNQPFLVKKFE